MQVHWRQKVALVPQQNLWYFVTAVVHQLLQPVFSVVEGVLIGKIKHNNSRFRKREIIVDNRSVPFLASRVPKLEVKGSVLVRNLFKSVVNADSGLLRVELSVDVAYEEGALAHRWSSDYDSLEVFQTSVLYLAHYSIIASSLNIQYCYQTLAQ